MNWDIIRKGVTAMKKRLFIGILAFCMLCSTACKYVSPETPSEDSTATNSTSATTVPEPTADYSHVPFTPVYSSEDYFESKEYYCDSIKETHYYLFHEPLRDIDEPMPLVIFFHGKGDSVTESHLGTAGPIVKSLMELENQDFRYSTYTLVPSSPLSHEGGWTIYQILAFRIVLSDVLNRYNIDKDRIYVSGISMGGFMTCQLVSEMPDTFAAAVPLSGAGTLMSPEKAGGTAFRIYHYTDDPVVSVTRSRELYQQLVKTKHPNVELIEYPTGSHISPIYTVFQSDRDAFFSWLFSQRRSSS